jgi:ketopantoate reductase
LALERKPTSNISNHMDAYPLRGTDLNIDSIGSFYAYILSKSDNVRLTVVARSNYDAVRSDGLTINSEVYGSHTYRPHKGIISPSTTFVSRILTATTVVKIPAEAQRTFDYVVCAHKAIGQSSVPAQLAPVVDAKKTTLVIIQNGVGNEEPFRSSFPDNTIITCVVRHTVSLYSRLPLLHHLTANRPGLALSRHPPALSSTQNLNTLK